jgi:hypothetical protein
MKPTQCTISVPEVRLLAAMLLSDSAQSDFPLQANFKTAYAGNPANAFQSGFICPKGLFTIE